MVRPNPRSSAPAVRPPITPRSLVSSPMSTATRRRYRGLVLPRRNESATLSRPTTDDEFPDVTTINTTTNARSAPWLPTAMSAARGPASATTSRTPIGVPSAAGIPTSSGCAPSSAPPPSASTYARRVSKRAKSPAPDGTPHAKCVKPPGPSSHSGSDPSTVTCASPSRTRPMSRKPSGNSAPSGRHATRA